MDDKMADLYKQLLEKSPNAAKLRDQQRGWLINRRRACGSDRSCLEGEYRIRIRDLGYLLSDLPADVLVIDQPTQDDVSQASEILTLAADCPFPLKSDHAAGPFQDKKEVERTEAKIEKSSTQLAYVKDRIWRQAWEHQGTAYQNENHTTQSAAAPYSQLDDARLSGYGNDATIVCLGGRNCIATRFKTNEGLDQRDVAKEFSLNFCDRPTAERAVLALKVLIRSQKK
jgi:uncharacterized protein